MRIALVMPAYNVAGFVGAAIESVLAQTHRDWILRVVDDGSTDDTVAVVSRFRDRRIRLVKQVNAGVSAARNRGLATIDGAAVLFLDADDWLAPDALERLEATLQANPEAVAAYGGYSFMSEDGRRRLETKSGPFPSGVLLERLLVRNLFTNGGHVLIRAEVVRRLVGFRSDIRYGEDWEFWCRLAALGPFAAAAGSEPLLFVRRRGGSAVHRLASDPHAFVPCMDAIFSDPALRKRFGTKRLTTLRARAEAENRWIIGRELIRHGRRAEGKRWLRRSVLRRPSVRRLFLLLAAHALPLLPGRLRGPFRSYRAALTPVVRAG